VSFIPPLVFFLLINASFFPCKELPLTFLIRTETILDLSPEVEKQDISCRTGLVEINFSTLVWEAFLSLSAVRITLLGAVFFSDSLFPSVLGKSQGL
jgi:hypothetical protein